jgi:hypothetical protein
MDDILPIAYMVAWLGRVIVKSNRRDVGDVHHMKFKPIRGADIAREIGYDKRHLRHVARGQRRLPKRYHRKLSDVIRRIEAGKTSWSVVGGKLRAGVKIEPPKKLPSFPEAFRKR